MGHDNSTPNSIMKKEILVNELKQILKRIEKDNNFELTHRFAYIINELGYYNNLNLPFGFDELIDKAIEYYSLTPRNSNEKAISLNNIGVLLCNSGNPKTALKYFIQANELRNNDKHIIENIQIAEILVGKREKINFPKNLELHKDMFLAYFDPHGM